MNRHLPLTAGILLLAQLHTHRLPAQEQLPPHEYEVHPELLNPDAFEQPTGVLAGPAQAILDRRIQPSMLGVQEEDRADLRYLGKVNPVPSAVDSLKRILNEATEHLGWREGMPLPEPVDPKASSPSVGFSFDANTMTTVTPPDNGLAINDQDVLVSVNNGGLRMYRYDGTLLADHTWHGFTGFAQCFDPRVIYDAEADRFVITVLSGTHSSTSRLLLLLSSSIDPMAPWHMYDFPASQLTQHIGSGNWMDFPAVGLSDKDLFVSVNLFSNNNDIFQRSVIFQVPHGPAYAGGAFTYLIWSVPTSPFSGYHVTPAPNGWSGRFGTGQYFVESRHAGGGQLRVLRITDHSNGSPQLTQQLVNVTGYSLPADAHQPGSIKRLKVNSCAMQNVFHLDGHLHGVLTTASNASIAKVRYIRIRLSNMSTFSTTFHSSAENSLAYPCVMPYSNYAQGGPDRNVIVGMLSSNATTMYPSIRVVNCDDAGTWSNSVTVKAGQGHIAYTTNSTQRWGDYIGMCREHTASDEPRVWIAGAYGTSSHVYRTRIAQIGAMGSMTGLDDLPHEEPLTEAHVHPNPASERAVFEFIVEEARPTQVILLDPHGRMVRDVFAGLPRAGRNQIAFDVSDLPAGLYLICSLMDGAVQHSERIVVQ
ncbi:MAG: hypothetical protein IPM49_01015 [Flavobacteriales bacterium]|nr:hypothetical protein [Flavobacteriales bacterium]